MKTKRLWVDAYSPKTIDELIVKQEFKDKIKSQLDNGAISNFLFSGPPGTGKTLTARLIAKQLGASVKFMNASDERGINDIRDKVKGFASVATLGNKPKVIILDEAEAITYDAQKSLKGIMDLAVNTRFILTSNEPNLLSEPILSRCQPHIKMDVMEIKEFIGHIINILQKEEVEVGKEDVSHLYDVCKSFYPDMRSCLNYLQFNTSSGTIDKEATVPDNIYAIVCDLIKKGNLIKIREAMNSSSFVSTTQILKYLFYHVKDFTDDMTGSAEIIIADTLYKESTVLDKEINLFACIVRLSKI